MRSLTLAVLLPFLTACTGCESTEPEIIPMPAPEVMSEFKAGDNVIVTFPDGETVNGEVLDVGPIQEFRVSEGGPIEKSRAYLVLMTLTIEVPNEDGSTEPVTMTVQGVIPEFAITLRRRINEKAK